MDSWSWEGEGGEGEEEVAVGSDDEDIEGAGGKEDGDEETAGDTTLLELFNVSCTMHRVELSRKVKEKKHNTTDEKMEESHSLHIGGKEHTATSRATQIY